MSSYFLCHVKMISFDKQKLKNFTIGKKYLFKFDDNSKHQIMNDKKEWIFLDQTCCIITYVTTKCRFIKELFRQTIDNTILEIILSADKKTFLFWGEVFSTKEYLKIL